MFTLSETIIVQEFPARLGQGVYLCSQGNEDVSLPVKLGLR